MIGEPIVKTLEAFAEPIIVLMREGPGGLWEWIKEKLVDLKQMFLDEIESWLITKVIKAGITWIISLLNPVSAFLKACKAIYDIVMFFVERARQVAELVIAIVDSIAAIARGSIGGAAKRVEDALAKSLPVAIGLLASLLGLGDISGTIKRFIDRIRRPVETAIRWLINKAVALVKAAGRMLGIGKKSKESETRDPRGVAKEAVREAVRTGMTAETAPDRIAVIRQRLRPVGLTGLELRGPDPNGAYQVLAAASEFDRLMTLIPSDLQEKPRKVVMKVTLTLSSGIDLRAVSRLARSSAMLKDEQGQPVFDESGNPLFTTTHYATSPSSEQAVSVRGYRGSRPEPKITSGAVLEPVSAEDTTLRLITYNTSDDPRSDSRTTHAEHQLEQMISADPKWEQKIVAIEADINFSPCLLCTPDMVSIAEMTRNADGRRKLTYKGWYTHKTRGTTAESLDQIRKSGWDVKSAAERERETSATAFVEGP
jgi:hypothetical protein